MTESSLSVAIAGKLAEQEEAAPAPKTVKPANQSKPKPKPKKAKPAKTVLVGGHFPPEVLKQLKLIAVEEDTTNQALLQEALDLLFLKKGRAKIDQL
ncbi:MAG: ribbon-helix-helix domain-containing protein [Pseudomonadota bacterium]